MGRGKGRGGKCGQRHGRQWWLIFPYSLEGIEAKVGGQEEVWVSPLFNGDSYIFSIVEDFVHEFQASIERQFHIVLFVIKHFVRVGVKDASKVVALLVLN